MRVDPIVKIDEIDIQEGYSGLQSKMRDISIHSQPIIEMNLLDKSIPILLGLFSIGSEVEVEVSHLALISPISIEDHLDISLL